MQYCLLLGSSKKLSPKFGRLLNTSFWAQNCRKQKILTYSTSPNTLNIQIGYQVRLKMLLLFEKKYIEQQLCNKNNDETVIIFSEYINNLNSLSYYNLVKHKIVINNWQTYVKISIIWSIVTYYLTYKYYDKIKNFINSYYALSIIVICCIAIKKLTIFTICMRFLFKKYQFTYKLTC